ncbi:MAG: acyclic terpene utilization AtuA family protein [Bryobacteraceae bacterium]|nr:acyclic terpene utilization AtuA family protein [Bryobacteraceae bacterium]
MIRIGNAQGFWGDWLEAPVRMVEDGPLDYLTLDYLAEVTMSILQKQRKENPSLGYARDFPPLAAKIGGRGVKIVANAGGVNPIACAREVKRLAPRLKVAVIVGDDIMGRLDLLGDRIASIRDRVLSANAYIGAFPVAEALATGADIVIGGRIADASLALGPMVHAFGWRDDDWDKLASGIVGGHIIECGTQATGGNCSAAWETLEGWSTMGYPILEVEADGSFRVTKHAGSGGTICDACIKEQLVYEIQDPSAYFTPDVVADFTTIHLQDAHVTGVKGKPRPEKLKVSVSYHAGWRSIGTITFPGPQARRRADIAERTVRERLDMAKLAFDATLAEYLGDDNLMQLRFGVRGTDRAGIERFTREMIPLVLSGPPGATGYGEGRPAVREIVAYAPAYLPREAVTTRIEVLE